MSRETVQRFLARLSDDAALAQQLREDTRDSADAVAAIVAFAGRRGFEFSAEDFLESQANREVSDAELDACAGGAGFGPNVQPEVHNLTPLKTPLEGLSNAAYTVNRR